MAPSDEEKLKWVSDRFKINLNPRVPQACLIASLMVENAIDDGELAGWEIEALDLDEIPELPKDRALGEQLGQ